MKQKEMIKFFEAAGIDPTKGKAKQLVENAMDDFIGKGFVVDEDYKVHAMDGRKALGLLAQANKETEVTKGTIDSLIDYCEAQPDPNVVRGLMAFLMNIEGYDADRYMVDGAGGHLFGFPDQSLDVIIVKR